jgi:hypothetical protein
MWNSLVKYSAYLLGLVSLPVVGFLILLGIVIAAVYEHLKERDEAKAWREEIARIRNADAVTSCREDQSRQARVRR